MAGKDTVWFNSTDNLFFEPGQQVTVLYQQEDPRNARVNVFADLWGDTVVYGGIPAIILLVIFIHPHIIPYKKKVKLANQQPFIHLV